MKKALNLVPSLIEIIEYLKYNIFRIGSIDL